MKKAPPTSSGPILVLSVEDAQGKELATGRGFILSVDGKLLTFRHLLTPGVRVRAKTF